MGLPILGNPIGQLKLCADYRIGSISNDLNSWAKFIEELSKDEYKYMVFSNNARNFAKKNFDIISNCKKIENFINEN